MGMESIKYEFLNYLSQQNDAGGENSTPKYNTEAGDMCIMLYADEFKAFLSTNNYADASIMSKTVTQILSMNFENGRLVENDDETTDTFESESDDEEQESDSNPASQLNQESMLDFISAVDSGMAMMPAPATTVEEPVIIGSDPTLNNVDTKTGSDTSSLAVSSENQSETPSVSEDTEPSQVSSSTSSETPTQTSSESTYPEDVQSVLDEIYNSPEALQYLDLDGDGQLSDGEKLLFEKFVQGDKENLTAEDLQKALNEMKEGKFKYDPSSVQFTEPTKPTESTTPTEPTMTPTTQPVQQAGGSSGGGGSVGGGGGYHSSSSSKGNKVKEKTLDNMSKQELEAEKATAEGKLADQQTTLNNIFDDKEGPLAGQKKDLDTMYGEYQTALKEVAPELAEQLDSIVGQIAEQEGAIDKQEVAVSNQEVAASASKNSLDNAKATQSQAQSSLDELNAVDQSELDDEQKATLQEKIDAANKALEDANNAVTEAEQAYNQAQEALKTQQETLDQMKGEEGLAALQAQKDALDAQIAEQHPEMVELQNKYNDAKKDYDKQKADMISTAKNDILSAQSYINDINTAINKVENKQLKKDLSFSKNGEIFGTDIDKAAEYVDDGEHMPYMVIGPKDPDPNKEYPVVVYLHGDYQTGGGKGIMDETMPGVFMGDELPEDFDGYIICPQLTGEFTCGENWENDEAEAALRDVIEDFSQSHNVDKDKIALTGASRGAMGVEYLATHMADIFCRAAAISSFPSGVDVSDIPIPILGLVGYGDRGDSISYMQSVYEHLLMINATHDTSPNAAFNTDSDGNGRADIYEWLFAD